MPDLPDDKSLFELLPLIPIPRLLGPLTDFIGADAGDGAPRWGGAPSKGGLLVGGGLPGERGLVADAPSSGGDGGASTGAAPAAVGGAAVGFVLAGALFVLATRFNTRRKKAVSRGRVQLKARSQTQSKCAS